MKFASIWITLLVLIALAVGYFLIPSPSELALYRLKSNKYEEAEDFYRTEYARGINSPDLIYHLSQAYELEGNIPAAISVMKEYVNAHPEDYEAEKRLAELYQSNQEYDEYLKVLLLIEKNPKLQNPEEKRDILEELETYQAFVPTQQIKILNELISTGLADEGYYTELAHLYADQGKYDKARSLLEKRRQFFERKVILNDIIFEAWVILQKSQAEGGNPVLQSQAVDLVVDFLMKKNDLKQVYYALGYFEGNFPTIAPELIAKLSPLISKDPNLLISVLQFQLGNPKDRKAASKKVIEFAKTLPNNPTLQNMAFDVLLDQGDDAKLIDFMHRTNLENIELMQIYNLAEKALSHKKPILAKEMQQLLGRDYLTKHPLIATILALGAQDKDARVKLDRYLQNATLLRQDSYYLFSLAVASKFDAEALQIGATFPPFVGMSEDQILEVAQAYVEMKKAQEIRQMIENSLSKIGKKNATPALLMLAITAHQTRKASKWLDEQKMIKLNTLNAFYLAAKESEEYPLTLKIAQRMVDDYPAEESRANYGFALVHNGEIETGLAILRTNNLLHHSDAIEEDYFSSLAFAVKQDPRYQDELRAFMDERESRGPLTKDLRSSFAYLYLDVLHDFEKAKESFQVLAEGASPQSTEVQSLVYLWGPHVTDNEAEWLKKRAVESAENDLGYWLDNLNYIGEYCFVIQLFEERSDADRIINVQAHFAYMDALAYEQQDITLRCVIDEISPYVEGRKQLEQLANYAEEALYPEARKEIWQRIALLDPDDANVWQNLAKAAFDGHDYSTTFNALQNYFQLDGEKFSTNPRLYEIFYELGESFRRARCFYTANHYFNLGIQEIDKVNEPTPYMRELASLMYYRLDEWTHSGAIELMQEAFAESGRDVEMGATYVNMMMDEGELMRAKYFLSSLFEEKCQECNED